MAYISSKRVREQCKKVVTCINRMYELFGTNNLEFTFAPQVGSLYHITATDGDRRTQTQELILAFDPLEVDLGTSKKMLKKEAKITEIKKNGNHFTLKP